MKNFLYKSRNAQKAFRAALLRVPQTSAEEKKN
jgi:hypothetical protein